MGANYACWHLPVLSQREFNGLSSGERLLYFARLAHLAPSTHNTQPWRFFLDEGQNSIAVYLDRAAVLPASDVKGRQATISAGAAMAHLVIAAEQYGLSVEMAIEAARNVVLTAAGRSVAERYARLGAMRFAASQKASRGGDCFLAIWKRKVMRAEFDMVTPVPADILRSLEKMADGKEVKLYAVTDTARRYSVAEFQAQADGFVINSKKFSRELGDWLLPNDSRSGLGMPGSGFGLGDAEARRMHKGLMGETPLEPEDGLKFSLGGKRGIETSPLLCFLTIAKDDPPHWVRAGIAFEKMFLGLTAAGCYVAVHAGIVEVGLINRMFSATLGTLRPLAVFFRAGHLKDARYAARPHSPRRPIEEVLLAVLPDSA